MFAVKLSGIILIVISSALIGFLKSHALVARYKKLSLLLDGINTLYENIEQCGSTLDIAIKNSFSKCEFLKFQNDKFLCLDADLKNDNALIVEFFMQLGSSTKKAECDRINNFKQKLKMHLKEAENDAAQKGKIYETLGICIGLTAAILLI